MKHNFFYFKTLLLLMLLVVSAFSGCGSATNNSNMNPDVLSKNTEDRSFSKQIDEILDKNTITTTELKTAYKLVKELEKDDKKQAKSYLQELKYCMYEEDAYGLADNESIFCHTAEEAEENIAGNYYGTWYIHKTEEDEMFSFTEEDINERAYYVRTVYTDYNISTMLIYGYLDEPDKLYCLEMDSKYCDYGNGKGDLILYVNYNPNYVPGLSYIDSSWCNFDKLLHAGILDAYERALEEVNSVGMLAIYEEKINNTVRPSYDGADTTKIEGDGLYFDEIVSGAWFDEFGQPIARHLPDDLYEKLFYKGYYAELKNLHYVDDSNVTLDYVKRYGYSTDAFLDEVYALILTDVYKREDNKGNKFFEGTEYYSGETVIIHGSFNGLMNGDSVMVIGPLHGLGSDDTANFIGVWCELINDRFSGYIPADTGSSEWSDTTYEDYGTFDVFDGYEAPR